MSRRQEHHPNPEQLQFRQTAIQDVQAGGNITIETITQNITQIVIEETGNLPPKVIKIDWRAVCHQILTQQQENQRLRRKATELGFELKFYVPLGLVERKQQQRRSASNDLEREEVYQLSKEVITKEYEHDAFLNEVIGVKSTDNKHVAIVGEPGAGKTTLLKNIADWIYEKEKGLSIFISLANLQKKSLEDYLLEVWLEEALKFIDSEARVYQEAVRASLKQRFRDDGVWLLLDGLDEMAVSSSTSALATIQSQLSGWVAQARVALTSRLNVWDFSLNNPLANFQTYRTLEFSQEDVKKFIKNWFAVAENELLGTQLLAKLEESQYQLVRELVKNPLRLALLCQTWYYNQGELPQTRAGLYQRFVRDFYLEWKPKLHPITLTKQEELNKALGKLAVAGIESQTRFRLGEKLAYEVMGEQLFKSGWDWGWLNLVDRDADTNDPVYAFYHPTFQEYFAATAIDDWHFFLKHIPKNPSQGNYRIFEPQWKEVILLWLGLPEKKVATVQKEAFIEALIEFDDGCGEWLNQVGVDKGFYEYRAYFLAAAGIAEFGDCSRADKIVKQIVQWGFGYLDEKQRQQKFPSPIALGTTALLQETERTKAFTFLEELIANYSYGSVRQTAVKALGEIGSEAAIASLVKALENPNDNDDYIRGNAAEALGEIGSEAAIASLVKALEDPNRDVRGTAAYALRQISAKPHQRVGVITALKGYSQRFEECYKVIWHCAQNMTYPDFYQAWHKDTLDTSAIQSLDLADLPRILTEEIAKDSELRDKVQLICIDGSKIIDRDNPAVEIYDQMLDYDCSERPNGEPETMPSLKSYWHSLQRNSNKLMVLVFYDSTALEPEWTGFSQSLIDALNTFKGAICVITEQPVGNLKQFSSREPHLVENLVGWITSHHLD